MLQCYNVTICNNFKYTAMEKFTLLVSLLFLFTISSFAQKIYSVTNLEQASQEDLNNYLNKALKLKKNGKTVTIVSVSTVGATIIYGLIDPFDHGLGALGPFVYLGIPALATTAVGATMQITGSKRVKRINNIKNTASYDIKINLKPCAQYNLVTQEYQPSVRLRIRF